jgi:hypothetical protein
MADDEDFEDEDAAEYLYQRNKHSDLWNSGR